ncbi:hypothetical protein Tco_1476690 [Tanacetum coccineum]
MFLMMILHSPFLDSWLQGVHVYKAHNMFVDHMHHPWRTLATIINKCLSGKTTSNDKLRKSRIDILWGMFKRKNVDYLELIWEDLAYQIDHQEENEIKTRNMPYPSLQVSSQSLLNNTSLSPPQLSTLIIYNQGCGYCDIRPKKRAKAKSQKVKLPPSKTKLKGASSLTPEEQEAADIMHALKESKKTSIRQPGTGGLNEGTGSKLRVLNESTVISATSSKGTGIKLRVPDEEKDITEEKDDNNDVKKDDKDGDADDEGDDHISDTQDADDEDVKTESNEDDIYKYKIRVNDEMTDAAKAVANKITIKDTTYSKINSLLEVKIQSEVPHTQSSSMLSISVTSEPTVLTLVQESPLIAAATTLPPPSVSTTPPVPQ